MAGKISSITDRRLKNVCPHGGDFQDHSPAYAPFVRHVEAMVSEPSETSAKRTDLAGLTCDQFAAWSRALVGHSDRFHRALYRQVMAAGRFAPSELPLWREAEAARPGTIATLTAAAATLQHPPVVTAQTIRDPDLGDTVKLRLRLSDGCEVETVLVPMRRGGHHTVCVSCQVGCGRGCVFCCTGAMGLVRDLGPAEIVGQALAAAAHTGLSPRNVVFMGMGEPLDNLAAVAQAVAVFTDRAGFGLAHHHVTISTAGHSAGLTRLPSLGLHRVNLAVSLTAATEALRRRLMPGAGRHDLARLRAELMAFPLPRGRRILVSCVLMDGVNDRPEDAEALIRWCAGLRVLVNLIPFNPIPGNPLRPASQITVTAFRDRLDAAGIPVRLRQAKGAAVLAACGQLGSRSDVGGRGITRTVPILVD
jgi:23S rRNA (adenine2503-C2)-methyltransferase